jgi:hypothetical protein
MVLSYVIALIGALAHCVIIGPQGSFAKTWRHGAVVYAKVIGFEKEGSGGYVKLLPLATLSGSCDAAFAPEIKVGASFGNWQTTVIRDAPSVGSNVIVFLDRDINGTFQIPNGDADFLPKNDVGDRPCLFEVTGFDDPKVTETIENLHKLRGKQREAAEKAQAEKK